MWLVGVVVARKDPMVRLFAVTSFRVFILMFWLDHDDANILNPFLMLRVICANRFSDCIGGSVNQ